MTTLAHKLHVTDYFALAFGVMVGTAWLVVMDDILRRGGPLGAVLGFTVGALILLPIGYVYSQLVPAIPDSGGETAYVARFFSQRITFATGWMVFLSYFLTCPFEALAFGRISGYLFPALNTMELYRLGGHPVYLPHLVLGLTMTVVITWLNYRGIQTSARVAKFTTFAFLSLIVVFAGAGAQHGQTANLRPLFSHTPLVSIVLVWQLVPWLLGGFESVGKFSEEASGDFQDRGYSVAIFMTILAGLMLFWVVISVVAYVVPWQTLNGDQEFPTAVAFERALRSHWIVVLMMATALVASVQSFNANLVTSSRLFFAMGRRNLLQSSMGYIHPVYQTPVVAVVATGVVTAVTMFLGEAGLVPILEVGAGASAIAWMAGCACYLRLKPKLLGRVAAIFGLFVTSLMIAIKVLPIIPGHFTRYEWIALGIWIALGFVLRTAAVQSQRVEEQQARVSGA